MRGREKFAKMKPVINLLVVWYRLFPRFLRNRWFEKNRKKPGTFALAKRYALVKTLAKSTGDNVAVFTDAYLKNVQNIEIGSNVSFQPMSFIDGFGGIKIGNDVSFAEGASVFSMTHIYSDPDVPIKDQGMRPLPVVIEDNVWIGAKATILGGITLASGTIVAAGAVVTKSTERNTTVAGVPASVINVRK